MLTVGLTGGIASGKSIVARMLQQKGCHVIEADLVAHEFLKPSNPVAQQVVAEFGPQILDANGAIDRARLGEIVFGNPEKLVRLNALTHPPVLKEIARQLADIAQRNSPAIAVVVAALHVESGYYKTFDRLAVAWCTREQQVARLLNRGLALEQAERRIASQLPLDEKRCLADDVIDCSRTIGETQRQTDELLTRWKQIK
ncbi:MAG TPA: dephospho-CoA kinase [Candidatus Acidoferrales bacterium]|nr:dephospho-CoA kinase [Candidatus Acidoferrales bacterium]